MGKTILITGSTDGLGREAAKRFASLGHLVLLHGRSAAKLEETKRELDASSAHGRSETYRADLSVLAEVDGMADAVAAKHRSLDVLVNNAGVFVSHEQPGDDGIDPRFMVNAIAPYRLTQRLLPLMPGDGRVINLSSAAQAPVDPRAFQGRVVLTDFEAYAQSKLALTIWSRSLGIALKGRGPTVFAINPGSKLGTKMVKEAFGVHGRDLRIGVEGLRRGALDDAFAEVAGEYFDNDVGEFAPPHPDALNPATCQEVVGAIESYLARQS